MREFLMNLCSILSCILIIDTINLLLSKCEKGGNLDLSGVSNPYDIPGALPNSRNVKAGLPIGLKTGHLGRSTPMVCKNPQGE